MKIAVTAASGQLGASIVNQLKTDIGAGNVIGIARTPVNAEYLGIEIRKGDYNSKEQYLEALKGVDAVLLVSGMDHPDKRIEQHRNVIAAAKENGVKKIVYTSIFGAEEGNAFSPVVASNRKTEEDVQNSGLNWAIGRNGIYIEPDLEYIDNYLKDGGIINCADEGRCGYTSRKELAVAYSNMLRKDELNGGTYNLFGESVSQQELADAINKIYGLDLKFENISVESYRKERKEALGEFLGTVIAGIYEGIKMGKFDGKSHFEEVSGRPHHSLIDLIKNYKSV